MTIDLDVPRRWWTVFAILFGVLGVPFGLAGLGLVIAVVASFSGGLLASTVIALAMGAVFIPAAVLAARIARSHPHVVVEDSGITLQDLGVLRGPVSVARADVHSVYFGSAVPNVPSAGWVNTRSVVSNWYAPDISFRWMSDANLLIVLAEPLEMRSQARFGIGLLRFANTRGNVYWGPTKWSIVRGFFAKARDESVARAAFAGWPTASEPPAEVMAWLRGPGRAVRR